MILLISSLLATVLLFLLLIAIPSKLSTNLLIKIALTALLIVVLTYLLYSLYSLEIAVVMFANLLVFFSVLFAKQSVSSGREKKLSNSSTDKGKQLKKKELPITPISEKKTISTPIRLDQSNIDALVKAVSETDTEPVSKTDKNIEEENTATITKENMEEGTLANSEIEIEKTEEARSDSETIEIQDLTELNENKIAPNTSYEKEEEQLADLFEDVLVDFTKEREPIQTDDEEKSENEEANIQDEVASDIDMEVVEPLIEVEITEEAHPQLVDIEIDKDDELEEIFEGVNRQFILDDREEDIPQEKEPLVIHDRGLIAELKEDTVTDVKPKEPTNTNEKDKQKLNHKEIAANDLIQKRSKLFEQLEEE